MTSSEIEACPSWRARPLHSQWMQAERFALWFPLTVFFVTRAVNAVMFALASGRQIAIPFTGLGGKLAIDSPASPDYWVVASNWDGRWYGVIATYGYPDHLPLDSAGQVLQNAYAFPPLYPMLTRFLMLTTGLDFTRAGPIVSLVCGAGAMVLVYRLVADSAGRRAGALTVVLVCTFMSAPVFQMCYSEGLTLLLVSGSLTLLSRRRYALLACALLLLSLTRPVGSAVVLVVLVHGLMRYRNRSREHFSLRDRLWVLGVAGFGTLLAGLWPLCVALMTGEGDAYLNSMAAWTQDRSSRALSVWPVALWQLGGFLGLLALLLLVMAITWLVRRPGARQWTVEVRAWAWAYPLYLLFVTGPAPSTIRHGVLAFPLLWPFVERTKGTDRRAQLGFALALAAVGLVAQWVWINDYVVVTTRADSTFP
ncbi:MAG: hypothetical protein H7270_05505 [Dermatophilaceae bacterium]|nr:hypothetical protein [Dermatophilaceae bacterium]